MDRQRRCAAGALERVGAEMKIKASFRPRAMWDEHYENDCDLRGGDVFESDRPQFSALLGPDGQPLEYEYQPIGFDLRARR